MKYVYIIENDAKAVDEILETLKTIDPQIKPRLFYTLAQFANWIQQLTQVGKKSIAQGGSAPGVRPDPKFSGVSDATGSEADQLACLISNNNIFGNKHLPLMKKVQDLFISQGLCKKESPTALVVTAYDDPDFNPKTIEARLVNNVILKPFDKLILRQHLIYAMSGRQPPSGFELSKMKTSAMVEMLKEVEVEAFSMVGFVTHSTRPLPVGAVAKYYGDVFKVGETRSVFARCFSCEPHPYKTNMFRCSFTFFGTESTQISAYRKHTLSAGLAQREYRFSWRTKVAAATVNFAVIEGQDSPAPLSGTLERMFPDCKVTKFKSAHEFVSTLGQVKWDGLLVHENFVGEDLDIWKIAKGKVPKAHFFMVSNTPKKEIDLRKYGAIFSDIFYEPVERNYFSKKIFLFFSQLRATEDLESKQFHRDEKIEVGIPIQVTEVSEAGVVMKYYRAITIGSFRRFVLWYPPETGMPIILGACNFNEPSKTEKGQFENHFVFYGVGDEALKHIRIWIRDNYVLSKQRSG